MTGEAQMQTVRVQLAPWKLPGGARLAEVGAGGGQSGGGSAEAAAIR